MSEEVQKASPLPEISSFGASGESTTKKSRKRKAGDIGSVARAHTAESSNRPAVPSSARERAEKRWFGGDKSEATPAATVAGAESRPNMSAKIDHLNAEPVSEAEAPLDRLSETTEKPLIVRELAEARQQQVAAEALDNTPGAADGQLAAQEYLTLVAANPENPTAAYHEVMDTIGVAPEAIPALNVERTDVESPPVDAENLANISNEFGEDDVVIDQPLAEAEPVAEAEAKIEDDDPVAAARGPGTTGSGTRGAGAAGYGAGGPTPGGPAPGGPGFGAPGGPPFGPGGPAGPTGFGGPGGPGFHPGFAPTVPLTAPNTLRHVPEYHDASPAAMALFGGIVGYLIGRRRGRIKTEKRLLPIQKRLEKQVDDQYWQLREQESKIRQAAAKQATYYDVSVAERINRRSAERAEYRARHDQERIAHRKPAPEANQLHGTKRSQEHIGHMLIAAEAPRTNRPLKLVGLEAAAGLGLVSTSEKHAAETPAQLTNERHVATMNRAELLGISEQIVVGGSSLRQIYESHLVGERGLRRLVTEHLRGGDLQKVLRQEIVEREIDFERDPMLRDQPIRAATPLSGSGKAALDNLLQQAGAQMLGGSEEAAFLKARARYEEAQQARHQQQRRVIDISLAGAIAVLITAVALLFLRSG